MRSVDDIRTVLRAGADKVAINTSAIRQPELIREASGIFGSSIIVVSIEAIKQPDGSFEAFIDYGRQRTGVNALEWAVQAMELGAGELIVTSIDHEGTGKGFDLELTRDISESVSIPVIACGGAGRIGHIYEVITRGKADAVSVASMLHYNFIRHRQYSESDFSTEGNVEFLLSPNGNPKVSRIREVMVSEIKDYLQQRDLECRL